MRWRDIKTLEASALEAELERLAEEQRNLRFQEAIGPLEDPLSKRNARRAVARIKTAINQKKRSEEQSKEG